MRKKGLKLPTLKDPNTGFRSDNVREILGYLYQEYKVGDMKKESIFN